MKTRDIVSVAFVSDWLFAFLALFAKCWFRSSEIQSSIGGIPMSADCARYRNAQVFIAYLERLEESLQPDERRGRKTIELLERLSVVSDERKKLAAQETAAAALLQLLQDSTVAPLDAGFQSVRTTYKVQHKNFRTNPIRDWSTMSQHVTFVSIVAFDNCVLLFEIVRNRNMCNELQLLASIRSTFMP